MSNQTAEESTNNIFNLGKTAGRIMQFFKDYKYYRVKYCNGCNDSIWGEEQTVNTDAIYNTHELISVPLKVPVRYTGRFEMYLTWWHYQFQKNRIVINSSRGETYTINGYNNEGDPDGYGPR